MMLPRHQEPDPDRLDWTFEFAAFPGKNTIFLGTTHRGLEVYRHRDGHRIYGRSGRYLAVKEGEFR
jgi:hypothetical protein